jgi:hypothetical protein
MFPQLSEALLHERVRDFHRQAEASRRARLARQARRMSAARATQPVAGHLMAARRSLTTASRAHAPASPAGEPTSRRAA